MPSLDMGVDVGIDLGTSMVKIFTPDRGIVLKEPAVVAVDRDTNEILAIGTDAYRMLGRTSDRIAVVYPLKDGVISDYDLAEAMLTALVRLHGDENGRFLILIPFVLAFLSDTGAYFVGCAFGKHKLAPNIGPKKTIEGLVGGVLGAMLGMVLYCVILQSFFAFRVNYGYAVIYGLLGSLGAVFGDLCFSVIKRQTGIKDYGNLIPGHGGILDRFDSMMIVGPLVELLMILLPVAV